MRTATIDTPEKRRFLDQLKTRIDRTKSLVPSDKRYNQFRDRYYYVLQKHGISRKEGITAHGLRHEHLNNLYKTTAGHDAPVSGGNLHETNSELDKYGRQMVAERAGHSREEIASAYLGLCGRTPKSGRFLKGCLYQRVFKTACSK